MEPINPEQAQRVWQRVRGPGAESDTLEMLLALESECRQLLLCLQKTAPLRDSRGLNRLREECRRFSHIFLGLAMVREADVTVTAAPAVRGNAEGLLRQCYAVRRKAIGLLRALPEDSAFCAELLSQRMEEHCLLVLELLGSLPRN